MNKINQGIFHRLKIELKFKCIFLVALLVVVRRLASRTLGLSAITHQLYQMKLMKSWIIFKDHNFNSLFLPSQKKISEIIDIKKKNENVKR